jgi:hypothetical protein
MNWHPHQYVVEKLLPIETSLRSVRPYDAVRKFQNAHNRDSYSRIARLIAERLQHLVSGLAQPLGGDHHGGVEN